MYKYASVEDRIGKMGSWQHRLGVRGIVTARITTWSAWVVMRDIKTKLEKCMQHAIRVEEARKRPLCIIDGEWRNEHIPPCLCGLHCSLCIKHITRDANYRQK
jgi:hypothetical protein